MGAQYSSTDIFASKLICEDCGGFYGKKKWHSNSKYSRFIHQCNRKFHKDKDKCLTPNLLEEDIKLKFIKAYNVSMKDRNRVMQDTAEMIDLLSDTTQLEQDIENINDDLIVVAELVNRLIKENSKTNTSIDDYNKRYEELRNRYDKTKKKQEDLIQARNDKKAQALNMKTFLSNLRNIDDKLSDWNEHVWMLMVESAVVHRDTSITFKFQNGNEIRSS
jgi:vacuolar-type H+-ATPase subunit I/STV1